MTPIEFWMPAAGIFVLVLGLVVSRKALSAAKGEDWLLVLAGPFYAAPLAVFGAEHLNAAHDIMQGVPAWIPGRLFWAYFVGFALIAAGLSIAARKLVTLSSVLTAAMIFLFVLLIHLPDVVHDPSNRFLWTVALRDTAFAAGGMLLAVRQSRIPGSGTWVWLLRLTIAIVVLDFGIEHFLHPEFAPGVPLQKITPSWVPVPRLWGYLVGAILLATSAGMAFQRFARIAALCNGVVMIVATAALYLPILFMARGTPAVVEGVNYVFDTLFIGATALLLAAATPRWAEREAVSRASGPLRPALRIVPSGGPHRIPQSDPEVQ